jgi:glycogen synthase kinase 3 beta
MLQKPPRFGGSYSTSALPSASLVQTPTWTYRPLMVLGSGSFGTVYLSMASNGQPVALKKVKLDNSYSQELSILQSIHSLWCSSLIDYFYTTSDNQSYLWLVTEMMPESLGAFLRRSHQLHQPLPPILVKLFSYQLFSGILDIHSIGVTHRDIKTENCLVDAAAGRLAITDFGIAKRIGKNDESGSYVASRFYRAPELLLGCRRYNNKLDIWAAGCVIAEMLLEGMPMFQGSSNKDQLDQIMRVLAPPTEEDMASFEHPIPFPKVEQVSSLRFALPAATPSALLELLKRIFVYNPDARPSAEECMASSYFDELFEPGTKLPSGAPLSELAPRPIRV